MSQASLESKPGYWLFSRTMDLSVFLGSAILALGLLMLGSITGDLHSDTPEWMWVPAILMIDVAHVWSTSFRVYFDKSEFRRRFWLYSLVPVFGWFLGVALYSEGRDLFWTALAYLAVFHFVRQQYGWVALYRTKRQEKKRFSRWFDTVTIYTATVYPLIWWHANLPRKFHWFKADDFLDFLPKDILAVLFPLYCLVMGTYVVKSIYCSVKGQANPGKDVIVVTTAVCWYVGMITFNSDYAFTVTNVIIHGVPYIALIFWYMKTKPTEADEEKSPGSGLRLLIVLLATIWMFAFFEELLWDKTQWKDRGWLFGEDWETASFEWLLVPLLAVPQWTHYVLDGFIWKRRSNPGLKQRFSNPRNC